METRYQAALAVAESRGCATIATALEAQAARSIAVICKSILDLGSIAKSGLIKAYRDQLRSDERVPDNDEWTVLRDTAEEALFTGYKEHIQFAALSLDGRGARSWGEAAITLRDATIEARMSVFEENVALFTRKEIARQNSSVVDGDQEGGRLPPTFVRLPAGFRALWADRGRLCVAKLAGLLTAQSSLDDFPRLLLGGSDDGAFASFVEVHVYGVLTVEAVARVRIPKKYQNDVLAAVIKDELLKRGATLEFDEGRTP